MLIDFYRDAGLFCFGLIDVQEINFLGFIQLKMIHQKYLGVVFIHLDSSGFRKIIFFHAHILRTGDKR
ncbi:MAG TPA: hypothetical protein DEB64_03890 [Alistipes sp.]|nr:hypothetical protein [Alistipes sp.]